MQLIACFEPIRLFARACGAILLTMVCLMAAYLAQFHVIPSRNVLFFFYIDPAKIVLSLRGCCTSPDWQTAHFMMSAVIRRALITFCLLVPGKEWKWKFCRFFVRGAGRPSHC